MISTMFGVMIMIEDEPTDVTIQLRRSRHLIDKCIKLMADDTVDDDTSMKVSLAICFDLCRVA